VSEVLALKLSDIDSKCMLLRIEQGEDCRLGVRRILPGKSNLLLLLSP
jgi:hypothetical protein